ncbi:MAG: dihydrodipicolinate synthase family protein [Eubacteriales bacterium]|jgi:dihydrodipicolinate synthase/N-acetylneuraminate lyase
MKAQYITPCITVLDRQGHIDAEANRRVYEHLIQGGVSGILILGSIGEFFAIPQEEKKKLVDVAVETIAGRTRLFVGGSNMDFEQCVELCEYAYDKGVQDIMVISPYYFSLPDSSVEEYYDQLASRIRGNLCLYSFPARTGYDISPDVVLRLARKHKNITGIKHTITGFDDTRAIIETVCKEFPNFEVFSGFDENFAHNVLAGGAGCIGGLSNVMPEVCGAWVKAMKAEDMQEVARIQRIVDGMMRIYSIAPTFIGTIKKAMMLRGVKMSDVCAFPMPSVNEHQGQAVEELLREMKLI